MKQISVIMLSLMLIMLAGCAKKIPYAPDADDYGHTAPTPITRELNAGVNEALPLTDEQSFVECRRGLIAVDPEQPVHDPDGDIIWDMGAYDFIDGNAPPSVNPSLWRQAKLNRITRLLRETNLTISQIAERCGFQHQEAMIRMFGREMGMSPREYRQSSHTLR